MDGNFNGWAKWSFLTLQDSPFETPSTCPLCRKEVCGLWVSSFRPRLNSVSASASHFWQNHHVVLVVSWWQVDRWTGDQSTGNLILTYLAFWKSKIGATVQKLQAFLYRKYFRLKTRKFLTLKSNSRIWNKILDSGIKF